MGSPSAGISRCLLPCSVLRLVPGLSGQPKQVLQKMADTYSLCWEPGGPFCC
jgi:hypothetical protein